MSNQGNKEAARKKLVVVGDGTCGKTCLLIAFTKNEFPEKYIPTIFESYVSEITIDDQRVIKMALWDTAGQEDYELLRPLSYPNTDVLLICFAINNRDSFENVTEKWIPEIKSYCPGTPYLLVGTKIDLRTSENSFNHNSSSSDTGRSTIVMQTEGVKLAKAIEAYDYAECSAKTKVGIYQVFEKAAIASLGEVKKKRPICNLL